MENPVPVYRHPALTILVDDNQSFLDSVAFQLQPARAPKLFDNPTTALAWVREAYRGVSTPSQSISVEYDDQFLSFERRIVAVDVDRIYRQVMNPRRFCVPAVIVIDYAMPQMDGVAFCEQLADLPCKKILLTGQADDSIAIAAFNRGTIDRFIKKGAQDALDQLDTAIDELEHAFFRTQSGTMTDLLARHSFSFLSEPAVAALIGRVCAQYGFVEYYLFADPSGIVFIDMQGKATLMVVETEAGLLAHLEAARDAGAPSSFLDALGELRVLPYFPDTGVYVDAIGADWLSYCLPAQQCQGRQQYYWALFDLPARYLGGPIHTYEQFLGTHRAV